jgi:hypothetical protein
MHEIENGIQVHQYGAPPPAGGAIEQDRFVLGDDGDPGRPIMIVTRFPPGAKLPRHHHGDVFMDAVVQGASRFGDQEWHHAGTVRWFPARAVYGPVEAGPEGCVLLEFYVDRAGFKTTLELASLTPEIIDGLDARGINWKAIAK